MVSTDERVVWLRDLISVVVENEVPGCGGEWRTKAARTRLPGNRLVASL
jgi:hypothetical protein